VFCTHQILLKRAFSEHCLLFENMTSLSCFVKLKLLDSLFASAFCTVMQFVVPIAKTKLNSELAAVILQTAECKVFI